MSAEVSAGSWQWFCADCRSGEGDFATEESAEESAYQHDDLNHEGWK